MSSGKLVDSPGGKELIGRKRIKLAPEKAIFIFVDDILPPTAALMSSIYDEHK
jgi:hypothetical protein